ncbi:MAG: MFS transporter [Coxiellaceae bacterium]|nr:MFS transporter [Coxiellaceae bacterium]
MINSFKTGMLLSYICIASLSAAIITPALPHIQLFYGLSKGAVEWVVSIFLLGYVIGQLIYAPIANRYGRLTALRAGLLINLMGILICMLSPITHNYTLLLFGRLITALGAASGLSCTFLLINELLPPDRAKHAMSLSIISFTVGIGLAVLIGGLIAQYLQWQDCFLFLLAHGVLMYGLSFQFPETLKLKKDIHPIMILKNYAHAFSCFRLIAFSLVVGFVSVFSYCYSAAAPIYAQLTLHLSPSQYGYWNSINMIGMFFGGLLCSRLIKQYHEKKVLISGFALIFLGLIFLSMITLFDSHSALLFFIATAYLYLVSGLLFPTASFFALNTIEDRASASAVMSFVNMGSATLAVIVMGYLPFSTIDAFLFILCLLFLVALSGALMQFRKISVL